MREPKIGDVVLRRAQCWVVVALGPPGTQFVTMQWKSEHAERPAFLTLDFGGENAARNNGFSTPPWQVDESDAERLANIEQKLVSIEFAIAALPGAANGPKLSVVTCDRFCPLYLRYDGCCEASHAAIAPKNEPPQTCPLRAGTATVTLGVPVKV